MNVGQVKNKELIQTWKDGNSIPRFIIITGVKGSGKQTMANYIAQVIDGYIITPGISVDAVRESIENSYKCTTPTTYIFPNADKMSVQAKNALLKITEEPPRRAYFIMTVEDVNNTLATLKSRGTELPMDMYTYPELAQLTDNKKMLEIATTPGEINYLNELEDFDGFISFCEKVLINIGRVTGVNAFKIANNFKFKDDAAGYEPIIFFNTLMKICGDKIRQGQDQTDHNKYIQTIWCCCKYKRELAMTGVKKDSTFDMWILDMRDIWSD